MHGTVALQFNSGLTVDVAIVLDNRGHEVRALQTNPQGAVFTALAKKLNNKKTHAARYLLDQ